MQHLDLLQQIAFVRRTGESFKPLLGAVACCVVCTASIFFFYQSTDQSAKVVLLFVSAVSAILAAAILFAYPRFSRAARALRSGRRIPGLLQLEINEIDSEDTTIDGVLTSSSGTWEMRFGRPFGWIPQNGEWPCELIFLSDEPMPILVQLEEGLLFPTKISR